jgi:hypothetical protein
MEYATFIYPIYFILIYFSNIVATNIRNSELIHGKQNIKLNIEILIMNHRTRLLLGQFLYLECGWYGVRFSVGVMTLKVRLP